MLKGRVDERAAPHQDGPCNALLLRAASKICILNNPPKNKVGVHIQHVGRQLIVVIVRYAVRTVCRDIPACRRIAPRGLWSVYGVTVCLSACIASAAPPFDLA